MTRIEAILAEQKKSAFTIPKKAYKKPSMKDRREAMDRAIEERAKALIEEEKAQALLEQQEGSQEQEDPEVTWDPIPFTPESEELL
jgi:hypothetical protein